MTKCSTTRMQKNINLTIAMKNINLAMPTQQTPEEEEQSELKRMKSPAAKRRRRRTARNVEEADASTHTQMTSA